MAAAQTAPDFYAVLGVSRQASDAEIKKAYRRLARRHHPDVNRDDSRAGDRFAQINAAYDVLKDPEKRRAYDKYGHNWQELLNAEKEGRFTGFGTPPQGGRADADGQPFSTFDFGDLGSIFGQRRGRGFDSVFGQIDIPGNDISGEVEISLQEAFSGSSRTVTLDGRGKTSTLEVAIPAGVAGGTVLRLRGQGSAGVGNGAPGDLLLTVNVKPHPLYVRHGHNLQAKVTVPLADAIFGGAVRLPQLSGGGDLEIAIPPRTQDGSKLRLAGKGMPVPGKNGSFGDLYVEVHLRLPQSDAELRELGSRLGNI